MNTRAQLIKRSANSKTGDIPQSYQSRSSCPRSCPIRLQCYPQVGYYTRLVWDRVDSNKAGQSWAEFCASVAKLPAGFFRYGIAGDLPGDGVRIDRARALRLAKAAGHLTAYLYTHYDCTGEYEGSAVARHNRSVIRSMIRAGFVVNLSANNLTHADQLLALNLAPVASVAPSTWTGDRTPAGYRAITCPAVTKGKTCKTCALCTTHRRAVVVFPAHGARRKSLDHKLEISHG